MITLGKNGPYWLARWRDGQGRQRGVGLGRRADSGGAVTKEQALAECRKLEASPPAVAGPGVRLVDWVDTYLAQKPGLAPATVKLYRTTTASLLAILGPGGKLADLTRTTAKDWRAGLHNAGMMESTICRMTREARSLFAEAVRDELIPSNPFAGLKCSARAQAQAWHYLDLPAFERLIEAAPGPWRAFLGLARLAGLRQNEILRLEWPDVDLLHGRLVVSPPGEASTKHNRREVPIIPRLAQILFAESQADAAGGRVCPLRVGNLFRDFRALCLRAGMASWPRWCHSLRKAAETDWAREHPLHVVSSWLGHSPKIAVAHYLRPTEADFQRAAGRAEAAKSDI